MITNIIKNRLKANIIGNERIKSNPSPPPEEDITDALLMEDGSLFLMEDGNYFKFENLENSSAPQKSYWNFLD